jgi:deoxyhypusine monooxygenase
MTFQVAETCELALERIKWLQHKAQEEKQLSNNPYFSVDPAPPSIDIDVQSLKTDLLDESLSLFKRYRAIFSLRNIGSTELNWSNKLLLIPSVSKPPTHIIRYVK